MAKYDLSTDENDKKVTRMVRPFCNIGPACGGDEVTLDASELLRQPIIDVLWTEAEMRAAEAKAEAERVARMRSPTDAATRTINEAMNKAGEERKARKQRERIAEVAKAKDMAETLKALAG